MSDPRTPAPRFDQLLTELASSAGGAAHPQPAGAVRRRARQRMLRHRAVGSVLALIVAGVATFGIVHHVPGDDRPQIGVSTATPSVTASIGSPAVTSPPPSTTTEIATCQVNQLSMRFGTTDGASGQRETPLIFRNTSQISCRLIGSPALTALDDAGRPLGVAALNQNFGDNATSPLDPVIAPGESASAIVTTWAYNPSTAAVTARYAAVTVALPGTDGASVTIQWPTSDGCFGLAVHPFQFGTPSWSN